MPTLRLVYLTDQQYAGMTDHPHGAANNTTAEIPSINQEQTRLPIADATRNASLSRNASSSPVHLDAVQQKSGNERKRYVQSSFDAHFNKFLDFREKYGHCDASQIGENASLGRWCNELRVSYNKIQKNQKPNMKLSDEQIQRLNDSGFKWSLRESFLTSASMISWLSKQSMVIMMFLVLVRMCRLGDGVIN
jgi:hypothetical protein